MDISNTLPLARATVGIISVFLFAGCNDPGGSGFAGSEGMRETRAIEENGATSPLKKTRKVALAVGVTNYEHVNSLPACVNDAELIAADLRSLGFKVEVQLDPARNDLASAISRFKRSSDSATTSVFFYAGHGVSTQNGSYLLAKDAKPLTEDDFVRSGIPIETVFVGARAGSKPRTQIAIIDACRRNPFVDLPEFQRSRDTGIKNDIGLVPNVDPPYGSLIAYSAGRNQRSMEQGQHGVYSLALSGALKEALHSERGTSIGDLFSRVRRQVITTSRGNQTPVESNRLETNLLFGGRVGPIEGANSFSEQWQASSVRYEGYLQNAESGERFPSQFLLDWSKGKVNGSYQISTTTGQQVYALRGSNSRDGVAEGHEYLGDEKTGKFEIRKEMLADRIVWRGSIQNLKDQRKFNVEFYRVK